MANSISIVHSDDVQSAVVSVVSDVLVDTTNKAITVAYLGHSGELLVSVERVY